MRVLLEGFEALLSVALRVKGQQEARKSVPRP